MTQDALAPFDDRAGQIWFDGEMVDWKLAKIHVLNHGLHYGSCVYEGERAYGGTVFKLDQHTERLLKSAIILDMPVPFSCDDLNTATQNVLSANGIRDGYVRPVVWRGSEMMSTSARSGKVHVAIACWEWPSYFDIQSKMAGIRLTVAKWRRPAPDTSPHEAKASGQYMIATISKHAAEKQGFHDALMLDWRGYVAEATSANVFFVLDGELHTPVADCFLNGITRQTVIELAKKMGIRVRERKISLQELALFQECFLTGTAAEIAPVRAVDSFEFNHGEFCKRFVNEYSALVRSSA